MQSVPCRLDRHPDIAPLPRLHRLRASFDRLIQGDVGSKTLYGSIKGDVKGDVGSKTIYGSKNSIMVILGDVGNFVNLLSQRYMIPL